MTSPDRTSQLAAEALRDALLAYRDAATAWLDAVAGLGTSERQIADRLAIGRMILYRLRQFTDAGDLVSMLDHLPGTRARGEIAETLLPNRLEADAVCAGLIERRNGSMRPSIDTPTPVNRRSTCLRRSMRRAGGGCFARSGGPSSKEKPATVACAPSR